MARDNNILAIIVLYRMPAQQSPAFVSLQAAMAADAELVQQVELVLADNSPQAQPLPPEFHGAVLHDGKNAGLALRYNQALHIALQQGREWLLLLDQDTTLTLEYLREVLALTAQVGDDIVALVPKLTMQERIFSPHPPPFQRAAYAVEASSYGVLGEALQAYNSGAVVRTRALQEAGGFAEAYWLDFLDFVTFTRLQRAGGRLFVMRSSLLHELSEVKAETPASYARTTNRLLAEERFYSEYGSAGERFRRRVGLMRQVLGLGRRGRWQQAGLMLKFLFRRKWKPAPPQ